MRRFRSTSALVLLLATVSAAQQSLQEFAEAAIAAYDERDSEKLAAMFLPGQAPEWAAGRGLRGWTPTVMPAAPGFGDAAAWFVLSRFQGPEGDGDRVHPIVKRERGWALAAELDEGVDTGFTVDVHTFDMRIAPETQIVNVTDTFHVNGKGASLLMRLSPDFRLVRVTIGDRDAALVGSSAPVTLGDAVPAAPVAVRSGSILWLRGDLADATVTIKYAGKVAHRGERAGPDAAFLTAYWWPHIGRRPIKHQITLHVPPDWIAIGQGELISEAKTDTEYTATWRNDLAVCYLTLAAGPFVIAAETKDRDRIFRSYMMPDKVEKDRGKTIVDDCKRAVAFFEDRLGKFPYSHYYVVDSPDYYGLEAYSFTILTPGITSWAPTHEIGHTWFGGIVPSSYRDSLWNESITQYVDSVLFKEGKDGTLKSGYSANRYGDPLSKIATIRHRSTGEAYMRGAYVMHMFDREMGLDTMIRCLKRFCEERRGKLSDWPDFQAAVRKETGNKYDWFFDQWIYSGEYPSLQIASVESGADGAWLVMVEQDLDPPYRLSFEIEVEGPDGTTRTAVTMTAKRQAFRAAYDGREKPAVVRLITRGITHARPGEEFSLDGS
jgi:hypothetical protein